MLPGLVSVTFRALSLAEIVNLCAEAGLQGIEWGGDVHVPPGDRAAAIEAVRLCREKGLSIPSYGSYYRLGQAEAGEFETVLTTCLDLGAKNIRVWAGNQGSLEADEVYRESLVQDGRRCARLAAEAGVRLGLEFHTATLTDTAQSALAFIADIRAENLKTYWQISPDKDRTGNLADLDMLRGCLSNIHCHHLATGRRLPLAAGEADWQAYLHAANDGEERWVLIEFVAGDSPDALMADAAALNGLIARLS